LLNVPEEVTTGELATAMEAGAVVVDVREMHEYIKGHVPGVALMPMSEIEQRWQEIPTDKGTVYLVCATGARSGRAAEALRNAGVDAVNVTGGTKAWAEEGRPLETGQPRVG
jgi:rhodanese-related sulfurtransferase